MELHLTPDQETFIRQGIEAGRFHDKEDAVQEAMSLWEERERRRLEILAAVEQAEASLAYGQSAHARSIHTGLIPITTFAPEPCQILRDIPAVVEPGRRRVHCNILRQYRTWLRCGKWKRGTLLKQPKTK
jgi:putative addiction module CopG family antidote